MCNHHSKLIHVVNPTFGDDVYQCLSPIDGNIDYWVDHIGPNKMRVNTKIDGVIRDSQRCWMLTHSLFLLLNVPCLLIPFPSFSQDNMLKGTLQGMKVDLHVAPFRWKVMDVMGFGMSSSKYASALILVAWIQFKSQIPNLPAIQGSYVHKFSTIFVSFNSHWVVASMNSWLPDG